MAYGTYSHIPVKMNGADFLSLNGHLAMCLDREIRAGDGNGIVTT